MCDDDDLPPVARIAQLEGEIVRIQKSREISPDKRAAIVAAIDARIGETHLPWNQSILDNPMASDILELVLKELGI